MTHKQERQQKRFMKKVQDELRRREIFKPKRSVLATRTALRQMGRS